MTKGAGPRREPRRNAAGDRITRAGTLDKRHLGPPRENGGKAYARFEVQRRGTTARCWWVIRIDLQDGSEYVVTKHTSSKRAEFYAELERVKQPDRKPSKKLKHVLGLT